MTILMAVDRHSHGSKAIRGYPRSSDIPGFLEWGHRAVRRLLRPPMRLISALCVVCSVSVTRHNQIWPTGPGWSATAGAPLAKLHEATCASWALWNRAGC